MTDAGRLGLNIGAATHVGQTRQVNQDSYVVADGLWAVADGMGGHAAGEVASAVALEQLQTILRARPEPGLPTPEEVVEAVAAANQVVLDQAADHAELRGMGTTLVAIAEIDDPSTDDGPPALVLVNVGDSRIYRLAAGELEQISHDHKMVQDLVDAGELTAEAARQHPSRNILTRALGISDELAVDSWVLAPAAGDRYLMCSDGLCDELSDGEIAAELRTHADPQAAADVLVARANAAGGHDNITVVIVDVVDDGGRMAAALDAAPRVSPAPPTITRTGPQAGTAPIEPARTEPADDDDADQPEPDDDVIPIRRATWRVAFFLGAIVAVIGVGIAAAGWYASSAYFVSVDTAAENQGADPEVVIYKGRPGGLLWFEPSLAERTGLTLTQVPEGRRATVEAGKVEPSLDEARRYVERLRDEAAAQAERALPGADRAATTTTAAGTPTTTG